MKRQKLQERIRKLEAENEALRYELEALRRTRIPLLWPVVQPPPPGWVNSPTNNVPILSRRLAASRLVRPSVSPLTSSAGKM